MLVVYQLSGSFKKKKRVHYLCYCAIILGMFSVVFTNMTNLTFIYSKGRTGGVLFSVVLFLHFWHRLHKLTV